MIKKCRSCREQKSWDETNFRRNKGGVLSATCLICLPAPMKRKRRSPIRSKEEIARIRALMAQFRARDIYAFPRWLTTEQIIQMEAKYQEAYERTKSEGIPYEVDHIEPLNGVDRSGLHVPWNLQVITQQEIE